jgi:hypothetical protein
LHNASPGGHPAHPHLVEVGGPEALEERGFFVLSKEAVPVLEPIGHHDRIEERRATGSHVLTTCNPPARGTPAAP